MDMRWKSFSFFLNASYLLSSPLINYPNIHKYKKQQKFILIIFILPGSVRFFEAESLWWRIEKGRAIELFPKISEFSTTGCLCSFSFCIILAYSCEPFSFVDQLYFHIAVIWEVYVASQNVDSLGLVKLGVFSNIDVKQWMKHFKLTQLSENCDSNQ